MEQQMECDRRVYLFSRAVTAKEVDEIFKKGIDGALSVDGTGKYRPFGPI